MTNIQAGCGLYAQRIVSRLHYDLDHAKRLALETAHMTEYLDGPAEGHANAAG